MSQVSVIFKDMSQYIIYMIAYFINTYEGNPATGCCYAMLSNLLLLLLYGISDLWPLLFFRITRKLPVKNPDGQRSVMGSLHIAQGTLCESTDIFCLGGSVAVVGDGGWRRYAMK